MWQTLLKSSVMWSLNVERWRKKWDEWTCRASQRFRQSTEVAHTLSWSVSADSVYIIWQACALTLLWSFMLLWPVMLIYFFLHPSIILFYLHTKQFVIASHTLLKIYTPPLCDIVWVYRLCYSYKDKSWITATFRQAYSKQRATFLFLFPPETNQITEKHLQIRRWTICCVLRHLSELYAFLRSKRKQSTHGPPTLSLSAQRGAQ